MLRLALTAAFALTAVAASAPVPKPREKSKDEQAFEGTWQVKGYEGGVPPPGDLRQMQFRFADGKWYCITDGQVGSLPDTYKLRSGTAPPGIDVAEGDRLTLGSYEIDGDRMKIVLPSLPKGERPTKFGVTLDVVVFTLTRVKDEKKGK